MLIFGEFFKTKSDKNIHQNTPKLHHIFKIFSMELAYAPEPPSVCVQLQLICIFSGGPNRGGVGGFSTPPEFWMGGLNTCQPPLILRKKFLGGVGSAQINLTL